MATLGQKIKDIRKSKNITLDKMANDLGTTKATLSRYENDLREPKVYFIGRIAEYLNVSIDTLIDTPVPEADEMKVPKEYTDKYKVTSRDKKQFAEEIRKANEAFFMDDELDESAKKGMLDLISEMFWDAKLKNKRVKKDK